MAIPPREKQSFYHSLAQLLRVGVPFSSALEKMAPTLRGPLRVVTQRLLGSVGAGQTVAEAFEAQRPSISRLEASVIGATERTGSLERGCTQLAHYFETLARAREKIRSQLVYPAFILHFGILLLALPSLVNHGWNSYLRNTLPLLATFYALAFGGALAIALVRDRGNSSPTLDRWLRRIPLFGKVRTNFAHTRFCLIYGLELEAGINVLDALQSAGKASRSGLIGAAATQALGAVRAGAQVGASLAASRAFPDLLTRALIVGEETGQLDRELKRLAEDYQAEAVTRMEQATEWSGKLINAGVLLYLGWRVVQLHRQTLQSYEQLLNF